MKTQRGLSLIEVMVALTIGMVLLLGVVTIFGSMRQSAQAEQKLSAVQNQQRVALYFLHVAVSGAGYNPNALSTGSDLQFPAQGVFAARQTLLGAGAGAMADSLSVRFTASPGGSEQGCSSNLTAGDVYTDSFSVAGGYLVCVETDNTAGTAARTVNLISGLTGINVLYGVDSTGSGSVTQYMSGDQVSTSALWASVKTAQVTLSFTNPLTGQPGQPQTVQLSETVPYMVNI